MVNDKVFIECIYKSEGKLAIVEGVTVVETAPPKLNRAERRAAKKTPEAST